jgi:hypothetical protein
MHRQTNASETLPFRGDAINEFFALCYGASFRIPHRILRSQNDFVMQLRERGARPGLAVADILLALETHVVTPEALCYLATFPERTHEGSMEAAETLHDIYAESLILVSRFPKWPISRVLRRPLRNRGRFMSIDTSNIPVSR